MAKFSYVSLYQNYMENFYLNYANEYGSVLQLQHHFVDNNDKQFKSNSKCECATHPNNKSGTHEKNNNKFA